jgi:hypothetical protein
MNQRFNLIFVCESWLTSDYPSSFLVNSCSYSVIRCDRRFGSGGGVCLFYDDTVNCVQIGIPEQFVNLELLCVDVFVGLSKQRFILCYNPPQVLILPTLATFVHV